MLEGRKDDPLQAFRFKIRIPEISLSDDIGFATVSGLNVSVDVAEYREGNEAITPRKMPGLIHFDNVTFTRGVLKNDTKLYDMFKKMNDLQKLGNQVIGDDKFRMRILVEMLDRQSGVGEKFWTILNAFPVNLSLSDLDANSSDAIIETLEVAHEGLLISEGK